MRSYRCGCRSSFLHLAVGQFEDAPRDSRPETNDEAVFVTFVRIKRGGLAAGRAHTWENGPRQAAPLPMHGSGPPWLRASEGKLGSGDVAAQATRALNSTSLAWGVDGVRGAPQLGQGDWQGDANHPTGSGRWQEERRFWAERLSHIPSWMTASSSPLPPNSVRLTLVVSPSPVRIARPLIPEPSRSSRRTAICLNGVRVWLGGVDREPVDDNGGHGVSGGLGLAPGAVVGVESTVTVGEAVGASGVELGAGVACGHWWDGRRCRWGGRDGAGSGISGVVQ